jgi:hypothetical protein
MVPAGNINRTEQKESLMLNQPIQAFAASSLAACALTLALSTPATAASVHFDSRCTPQLNRVDKALYEKASEGTPALRRYMEVRQSILLRDVYETAVWAERVAEARKSCIASTQALAPRDAASATVP